MIAVAEVVVRLPPHLASVDTAQRVVDGQGDEEVPRLIPALAIVLRHIAQGVKAPAVPPQPPPPPAAAASS